MYYLINFLMCCAISHLAVAIPLIVRAKQTKKYEHLKPVVSLLIIVLVFIIAVVVLIIIEYENLLNAKS